MDKKQKEYLYQIQYDDGSKLFGVAPSAQAAIALASEAFDDGTVFDVVAITRGMAIGDVLKNTNVGDV